MAMMVKAGAACKEYAISRSVVELLEVSFGGGSAKGIRRTKEREWEKEGGVDKAPPLQPDTSGEDEE
jgi:hypothetical protein